ncbi:hypothetical protein BDZ97DRAFT_1912415 [Flammula alnicola]|nr:hypothetical protein BDZ97DRAFT_1912415 [Flammula alnicola]
MDTPIAVIRPYAADDKKLVQFAVSKANFQVLAAANNKMYTHPVTIAIWLALSSVFIQMMSWWPSNQQHGWLGYLKPLPALASVAVPIMFFIDWVNRPYFEELTQEVLRHPDLKDISKYYSQQPASGFWILEMGEHFVGLIAIDATQPPKKREKDEVAPPKTALIRHFHVEEAYHNANIQDDLLEYAVNHAFSKDPKLERIEATDSPLVPYIRVSLRKAGFELDHHTKQIGIRGWKLGVRYLRRENWKKSS